MLAADMESQSASEPAIASMEAEQDAGLAAMGVGELADRVGDEEPAESDRATDRPASDAEPVSAITMSGPRPYPIDMPAPVKDWDSAISSVLRLISRGTRRAGPLFRIWCMAGGLRVGRTRARGEMSVPA